MRWTLLGWALTVIGVWAVAWGLSHLREAGMPNPHLLYDAGYSRSRQAESIFFGVWTLMFAYWAFSKART